MISAVAACILIFVAFMVGAVMAHSGSQSQMRDKLLAAGYLTYTDPETKEFHVIKLKD